MAIYHVVRCERGFKGDNYFIEYTSTNKIDAMFSQQQRKRIAKEQQSPNEYTLMTKSECIRAFGKRWYTMNQTGNNQ